MDKDFLKRELHYDETSFYRQWILKRFVSLLYDVGHAHFSLVHGYSLRLVIKLIS